MLSGQALLFDKLIKLAKSKNTFEEIKKGLFKNFKKVRDEIIKDEILSKFKIDKKFVHDALKNQIPNEFIGTILKSIAGYELKTVILLIGFVDGEPRISDISENGIVDLEDLNFHAIGSGGLQAANTLLFQRHSRTDTLKETL